MTNQTGTSTVRRSGNKIIFSVEGWHTTKAAEECAAALIHYVTEFDGPVEFVADLRRITGFTVEARHFWQDSFKQTKHRIKLITLVQGSAIARMTASAVGLYAGIKVRSVESIDVALKTAKLG